MIRVFFKGVYNEVLGNRTQINCEGKINMGQNSPGKFMRGQWMRFSLVLPGRGSKIRGMEAAMNVV